MVNQITHTNGVVDTQANDPDSMRRPSSISSAKSGTTIWSSGTYSYDGSGNVVKTGNGYYLYDRVSRLTEGRVYDGPTGAGTQKWQSYGYDAFGNILSIGGTSGRTTPTNVATNRLNGAGTAYDTAGNLTTWNSNTYQYDNFNQMIRMKSGAEDWVYVYTAGDERFWSYRVGGGGSLWALRDVDGKVLREYEAHVNWSTYRDYIFRGSQLLASSHPTEGDRHLHLDHLGTPRLITNAGGFLVAYHAYYPFGEEATAFNQDTEQMKFTGHERDLASLAGSGDDLDYMHARHCSPFTGRFVSVDTGESAVKTAPQTWNKFSYVANNPTKYLDPNGRELRLGMGSQTQMLTAARLMLPPSLRPAVNIGANKSGQSVLTVDNSVKTKDTLFKNLQRVVNSPGTAELNLVPSTTMVTVQRPNGSLAVGQLSSINGNGFTLPSVGTAMGNEPGFSPVKGETQIFMSSSLTNAQQAATLAAELGAHVLPALMGQGAVQATQVDHAAKESPLVAAALANAQKP
jgi:RHS repeat-associated protein